MVSALNLLLMMGTLERAREMALTTNGVIVTFFPSFARRSLRELRAASKSVISISSPMFIWGTLRESFIDLTIAFGNPFNWTVLVSVGFRNTGVTFSRGAPVGAAAAGAAPPPLAAALTSSLVMRPPFPVPETVERSTPISFARARTAGAASTPWDCPGPFTALGAGASFFSSVFSGAAAGAASAESSAWSVSMSQSGAPILMRSPSLWYSFAIFPWYLEVISTAALSLWTSQRGSISSISSPTPL
mmetsp:Transcript_48038/g.94899  ORF Transcript_48038/g.94899 Transcript_48038/m.94899 type:complete len:246 (-) Transcript_48038:391-1128(-)